MLDHNGLGGTYGGINTIMERKIIMRKCWLDFSKIPEESAFKGEVTGYCYMGSLGENQMSLLNRSIMRALPYTYRVWGSPASMFDGMIFVTDAHPTQIR